MSERKKLLWQGEEYVTCEELIGLLHDYVAGELPDDVRRELDRHLSICDSCVAYLDSYRKTVALARAAEPAIEDLPEDLVRALLAARR
jgi:anti-sigma factor RsiW